VMNADYVTQQPLAANLSKNRTDIDSQALIVSSLYVLFPQSVKALPFQPRARA